MFGYEVFEYQRILDFRFDDFRLSLAIYNVNLKISLMSTCSFHGSIIGIAIAKNINTRHETTAPIYNCQSKIVKYISHKGTKSQRLPACSLICGLLEFSLCDPAYRPCSAEAATPKAMQAGFA